MCYMQATDYTAEYGRVCVTDAAPPPNQQCYYNRVSGDVHIGCLPAISAQQATATLNCKFCRRTSHARPQTCVCFWASWPRPSVGQPRHHIIADKHGGVTHALKKKGVTCANTLLKPLSLACRKFCSSGNVKRELVCDSSEPNPTTDIIPSADSSPTPQTHEVLVCLWTVSYAPAPRSGQTFSHADEDTVLGPRSAS